MPNIEIYRSTRGIVGMGVSAHRCSICRIPRDGGLETLNWHAAAPALQSMAAWCLVTLMGAGIDRHTGRTVPRSRDGADSPNQTALHTVYESRRSGGARLAALGLLNLVLPPPCYVLEFTAARVFAVCTNHHTDLVRCGSSPPPSSIADRASKSRKGPST
jgi:hypothetical protein